MRHTNPRTHSLTHSSITTETETVTDAGGNDMASEHGVDILDSACQWRNHSPAKSLIHCLTQIATHGTQATLGKLFTLDHWLTQIATHGTQATLGKLFTLAHWLTQIATHGTQATLGKLFTLAHWLTQIATHGTYMQPWASCSH